MTREDIMRMAKEAKLNIGPAGMGQTVWGGDAELERFAALVAAAEREACARVCESLSLEWEDQPDIARAELATMMDCALAVRARSQA
jgi:hypothetical protein